MNDISNTPHSQPAMSPLSKIYIAGHSGLVGRAVMKKLNANGYTNLIVLSHSELDLTDSKATRAFFKKEDPEYVFVCAAKVGGIMANATYPAEFIHQNLAITANCIHESWRAGV